jgi:hypothetical protein
VQRRPGWAFALALGGGLRLTSAAAIAKRVSDMEIGVGIVAIVAALYFVPWIIALLRQHQSAGAIFVLNLFLGWTFLGWIVALVWSMTAVDKRVPPKQESYNFWPRSVLRPVPKKEFVLRGPEEEARYKARIAQDAVRHEQSLKNATRLWLFLMVFVMIALILILKISTT